MRQAQAVGLTVGIPNILQPGLVKEMIIAEILEHQLIISKNAADACNPADPTEQFEYLSCYTGGSGQLDRIFKAPADKRAESLKRITRNRMVFLAIFSKVEPLKPNVIYAIRPDVLLSETERQLDVSRNDISHVGFSENWAREHGDVVWRSTRPD